MTAFLEWFGMGGYAAYVWSSYSLAALVLCFNLWAAQRKAKGIRKTLQSWAKGSIYECGS